jgi:hypothetical protein
LFPIPKCLLPLANQERLSIPAPSIECLSQPGVLMF